MAKQTKHKQDWQVYKRLYGYIRPKIGWLILGFAGGMLFAATNALYADVLKQVIDYVADTNNSSHAPSILTSFFSFQTSPLLIVACIVVIAVFRSLGSFCTIFGINRGAQEVVYVLRNDLHSHYLQMHNQQFDVHTPGALTAKMNFTIDQVLGAASEALIVIIRESLTCIALFAVMIYYSWQFTLFFTAVLPLIAIILAFSAQYFRRAQKRIQGNMEQMTHLTTEVVTGQVIVKMFQAKEYEQKRFHDANTQYIRQTLKNVFMNAVSTPTIQAILAFVNAFVIWFALDEALIEDMSVGSFVAFFVAAGLLAPSIRKLSSVNFVIQKGYVAAQDIFTLLDQGKEDDQTGTLSLWRTDGAVRFANISLTYPTQKHPALRNVSFSIDKKATVAVIGKSGSGKSSLVKLLLRLYQPTKGTMYIDEMSVDTLTLASLRKQIAVVSQNTVLFNDTIAHNVAYGATHVNQQKLQDALRDANALHFVTALPDGVDTLVGDKGTLLSGGQAQRIAIARALYKQVPLLVFDEATSALDSESEKAIQDALDKTKGIATRFIITHRMATIQKADWLLVLDKGKLVQQGTESELRNTEGTYRTLLRGQFLLREEDERMPAPQPIATVVAPKKRSMSYRTKRTAVKARGIWRSIKEAFMIS